MRTLKEAEKAIEALRERISTLSATILRISASAWTWDRASGGRGQRPDAHEGALRRDRHRGRGRRARDYVTSGLGEDEMRGFLELPYGLRLFEHLRDLPGPLQLDDLPGYMRSLGHGPDLPVSKTLQVTPMRHRGSMSATSSWARRKSGRGLRTRTRRCWCCSPRRLRRRLTTRTHGAERQARADLGALVETTPVGVVVSDARNGAAGVVQPRGSAHRRGSVRAGARRTCSA